MQLPDAITPATAQDVSFSLRKAWCKLFDAPLSRQTVAILVAHWALETDHGRAMHRFNIGNIKSNGDGDWCAFGCKEVLDGVEVELPADHPGARFRAYSSLDYGVADYLSTLATHHSTALSAAKVGDSTGFAHWLKASRYYTANEEAYTTAIVSLAKQFGKELLMWPPIDNEFASWEQGPANWLDIVLSTAGWGYGDKPKGRREAFLSLIAPHETPQQADAMGRMSTCALSALGWLRCYGLDDEELWRPYRTGRAVADVVSIAMRHNAWRHADTLPELGDLVLVGGEPPWGGPEHIFCAIDTVDGMLRSCDGGQVDANGQCIKICERKVQTRGSQLWIGNRRVQGVARMGLLTPKREQVRLVALSS